MAKEIKKDKDPKEKPKYKRITTEEMTWEGAQRLAAAIVQAAVEDYRDYSKKLKELKWKARNGLIKRDRKYNELMDRYRGQVYINRKFFFSRTCSLICQLDPNWIVETIDEEVKRYDPSGRTK